MHTNLKLILLVQHPAVGLVRLLILVVVCWGGLVCQVLAAEDSLRFSVNEVPPYTVRNDPDRPGLHIELAREIVRRSGLDITVRSVPYVRLAESLRDGSADIAVFFGPANVEVNADRLGVFHSFRTWILSRRDRPIQRIEQLDGLVVGSARGAYYDQRINDNPNIAIATVLDPFSGLKMLNAGRLDALLTSNYIGGASLNQNGIDQSRFAPPLEINKIDYVIYVSRNVPRNKVEKLQNAVDEINALKVNKVIGERYGGDFVCFSLVSMSCPEMGISMSAKYPSER